MNDDRLPSARIPATRHARTPADPDAPANTLARLRHLPAGWDGHNAKPPTGAACDTAARLLAALARAGATAPQLFPVPDGGVQLEWHARGSVEIEVEPDGTTSLLVDGLDTRGIAGVARAALTHLSARARNPQRERKP